VRHTKVQSLRALREEMKTVARRERTAPSDASAPSFNSVEAIVRLLTPENRRLLAVIRDRTPQSVAELVQMTGRAQPHLTRTLAKFEAAGFITMTTRAGHLSGADRRRVSVSFERDWAAVVRRVVAERIGGRVEVEDVRRFVTCEPNRKVPTDVTRAAPKTAPRHCRNCHNRRDSAWQILQRFGSQWPLSQVFPAQFATASILQEDDV